MERIDKIISSQTFYSRNDVKKLIKNGLVSVDGEIINKSNILINEENSKIIVDNEEIIYKKYVYLILNKPCGYISASSDGNYPIVIDLVPDEFLNRNLFPVGRLDKDTTGLMIITDDGDFSHRVLSPKKHVSKKYYVVVDKDLNDDMIKLFDEGIKLNDGICKSSLLEIIDNRSCYVTLTEGRYHQIKRMFGCFNMKVLELKRVKMGNLELPNDLKLGECRELTKTELELILK